MPKLTNRFVEKQVLYPAQGQVFYRDSELKGFALRVTIGCKSYVVESSVQGKNRRITLGKHGPLTAELARRKAKKLLGQMAMGYDPRAEKSKVKASRVTLGQVLERFLSVKNLAPQTQRTYRGMLPRCVGDWLKRPITSITKEDVQKRHKELTKKTVQGTEGKCQANMTMELVRSLLNFAAINYETENGKPIIESNPVHTLTRNKLWHPIPRRKRILGENALLKWYQCVSSLRWITVRDYLLFILLTGLRKTEASKVKWADIDFEGRTLTIPAAHAKNKQEHQLPLSDFVFDLLKRRFENRRETEYVFAGRGGHGRLIDAGHVVESVAKKCGTYFTLHDLRRTYVSMAAKLQIPQYVVKRLVNHVSGRDVTDGYIIFDIDNLRDPAAKIANRFLELFGVLHPSTVPEQNALR